MKIAIKRYNYFSTSAIAPNKLFAVKNTITTAFFTANVLLKIRMSTSYMVKNVIQKENTFIIPYYGILTVAARTAFFEAAVLSGKMKCTVRCIKVSLFVLRSFQKTRVSIRKDKTFTTFYRGMFLQLHLTAALLSER